jgi:hypothetical protein
LGFLIATPRDADSSTVSGGVCLNRKAQRRFGPLSEGLFWGDKGFWKEEVAGDRDLAIQIQTAPSPLSQVFGDRHKYGSGQGPGPPPELWVSWLANLPGEVL